MLVPLPSQAGADSREPMNSSLLPRAAVAPEIQASQTDSSKHRVWFQYSSSGFLLIPEK